MAVRSASAGGGANLSPWYVDALSARSPFGLLGFLGELRSRGFIEGQNLTIDYRDFGPHADLISQYAAELVKAQVDVIYGGGGAATRAAQQATKTIPILGVTDDMVGEGLVNSLARPGGNTTGVSILAAELDGKRQEILIEAVPGIRRMASLADSSTTAVAKLNALQEAARAHNIELSIHRIAKGEEIPAAIDTAQASGATALNVLASPMLLANRRLIMDRVAARRIPAIYQWPEMAEEGGLVAYGPRLTRSSRASRPTGRQAFPGHQACRTAGRAADQVRAGDQSQDREGTRPHNLRIFAACRRGHRITTSHLLHRIESGSGPSRPNFSLAPDRQLLGRKRTWAGQAEFRCLGRK